MSDRNDDTKGGLLTMGRVAEEEKPIVDDLIGGRGRCLVDRGQ